MLDRGEINGRGVSEVYGTVLLLSMVFVVSVALVGIGFFVVSDASDDVDDRVAQDAMIEMDDRLEGVTGNSVEQSTLLGIPRGAGDDIETFPEEGKAMVTVETVDERVDEDDIAAETLRGDKSSNLGTISHEASDGTETVYQGGMLFETEGDSYRILSEPRFDYDGETIDFGLIDVSEIEAIRGGDEIVAQQDIEASQAFADEIEEMIAEQRAIGDDPDNPAALATIKITIEIETEYPEVWKEYGDRMVADVEPEVDGDRVIFDFGEIQGTESDEPGFADGVLYTGGEQTAHVFFNEELGAIEQVEDGFQVTQIANDQGEGNSQDTRLHNGGYSIAVVDDGMWKILSDYNQGNNNEEWTDVTGTETLDRPSQLESIDSDGGASDDIFEWDTDQDIIVCLLVPDEPGSTDTEEFRQAVAEGDCNQEVIGATEGEVPSLETEYDLTLTDPDDEEPLAIETETKEFDVEIENVGNALGEQYVYLAADAFGDGVEVVDFEQIELYPGETTEQTFELTVDPTFNDDSPVIIASEEPEQALEIEVNYLEAPNFEIDDMEGEAAGATTGEPFDVELTVSNDGAEDEQLIALENPAGDIVDTERIELETDETKDVTLTWNVPIDANLDEGVTLAAETQEDSKTLDVSLQPEATVTDVDTEVDNSNEKVTVIAELDNPSAETLEDAEVWIDSEETDLVGSGQAVDSKTVDVPTDGTTVEFDWDLSDEAITDWVTVRTEDDAAEDVGIVQRDGPVCSEVEYEGEGDSGDPYRIENVDQLQCIDDDLEADYELVGDIAAHGTEFWNDGDGFEPIGEQFGGDSGTPFSGDFDGQGHTIAGLTIDRYDEPFVGIFAITAEFDGGSDVGEGVTIENIELVDIDVRGMTVVGGLVGGAGGEFSQISVDGSVESQYQQVGGIVGHGHDADLTNELVSTATVEGNEPIVLDEADEHPWQESTDSPNLGIGGILGGMGFDTEFSVGYSRADVSGPSSVGGITGWTPNNPSDLSQMYWADGELSLDGETRVFEETEREQFTDPLQTGGIAGRIGDPQGDLDTIFDSVYSDGDTVGDGGDNVEDNSIDREPEEMVGPQVLPDDRDEEFYEQYPGVTREDAEGTMENLDWDIWTPVYDIDEKGNIINEDFPVFQWQVEGNFLVTIDELDPGESFTPGEDDLAVDFTVENTGDETGEQTVVLTTPDGVVADSKSVELDGNDATELTLTWETSERDEVSSETAGDITVGSQDTRDTRDVTLEPTDGEQITIESVDTDERIQAATEQLEVDVEIAAEETSLDDESVVLRANGALVDIDDDLPDEESYSTTLSWEPTAGDVGDAEIEVEILNQDERVVETVEVTRPPTAFVPEELPPISVDLERIITG